jgi:hypothetical protein
VIGLPSCPICQDELTPLGWCVTCHGLTTETPPPGFRWVRFTGGDGGDFGRMMQERYVRLGAEYVTIVDDGRYSFDGEVFRHVET